MSQTNGADCGMFAAVYTVELVHGNIRASKTTSTYGTSRVRAPEAVLGSRPSASDTHTHTQDVFDRRRAIIIEE